MMIPIRVLAFALALGACQAGSASSGYKVATAEIGDVRDVVPATGVLEAAGQVEIRASAQGLLTEIAVTIDQPVKAGQILGRLASAELTEQANGASASARASAASVEEADARLEATERELGNKEALFRAGFVSAAALDALRIQRTVAKAALRRSRAEQEAAEAQSAAARAAMDRAIIRAPFDGIVIGVGGKVGQAVAPADSEPLFVLAGSLTRMRLIAAVPESDVARIQPDMRIVFRVDAFPKRQREARFERIIRTPSHEGRFVSYPTWMTVLNPDQALLPGMTTSVEFIRADARQVLRIPIEALYYQPENYRPKLPADVMARLRARGKENNPDSLFGAELGLLLRRGLEKVFVLQDGVPRRREVRIGAETDDFVEVLEGLTSGEVVILGEAYPTTRKSGR